VQPGEPATRFRARARFDNAAVVAGSAEDLTVSAVAGDTAACFVAGEAASSAAAFAAAALASFPSGLPGSTAVGAVLASATSALLPSIAAGALLSPAVAGAALEAGPLPEPLNEILARSSGKRFRRKRLPRSDCTRRVAAHHRKIAAWGSDCWAPPALLIPNETGSVAAEMR
jgi:hypothetical protein